MQTPTKVVINYENTENFQRSNCKCKFCEGMHNSISDWETFIPETILQKNMKRVVAKIERREKKNKKRRKSLLLL